MSALLPPHLHSTSTRLTSTASSTGGDTYGFLSEQGWVQQLNASFSVVANQDVDGSYVKYVLACNANRIAAKVVLGVDAPVRCKESSGAAEVQGAR